MTYSLDTSAFLDAWERNYPIDVFPSLWEQMDGFAKGGVLISVEEVYQEMKKKADGVVRWAKNHRGIFLPLSPPIQSKLREIMKAFPKVVDPRRSRSGADPILVAAAMVQGSVVVTVEKRTGNRNKPRIPDVCGHFKVRCIPTLDMLRELKVKI